MTDLSTIPTETLLTEIRRRDAASRDARLRLATEDQRTVISAAAQAFGVDVDDLYSPGRLFQYASARQAAMVLLRTRLDMTYADIALLLRKRDHNTARYAVRTQSARMRIDDYADCYHRAEKALTAAGI